MMRLHRIPLPIGGVITLTKHTTSPSGANDRSALATGKVIKPRDLPGGPPGRKESFEGVRDHGQSIVANEGAVGPDQRGVGIGPYPALIPDSGDEIGGFDFKAIDACCVEMNEQSAHEDTDGLYLASATSGSIHGHTIVRALA